MEGEGAFDEERHWHTPPGRLVLGPPDRFFNEIDAGDLVAPAGEKQGVFTRATPGIQDAHPGHEIQTADRRPQLGLGERIEHAQLARIIALRRIAETPRTGRYSGHVGTSAPSSAALRQRRVDVAERPGTRRLHRNPRGELQSVFIDRQCHLRSLIATLPGVYAYKVSAMGESAGFAGPVQRVAKASSREPLGRQQPIDGRMSPLNKDLI